MSLYCVGLDLGQQQDYTACAVLQFEEPTYHQVTGRNISPPVYQLRHLERFKLKTPYPEIVARVGELMAAPALQTRKDRPMPTHRDPAAIVDWQSNPYYHTPPTLVVDATGVGAPVCDLLRAARIPFSGVLITGGEEVTPPTWEGTTVTHVAKGGPGGASSGSARHSPFWRVPKRDLVAAVQVPLQSGRLKFAAGMPNVDVLVKELLNFRVKINPQTAHDAYGAWREGQHDDLVLAVALAVWAAEFNYGPQRQAMRSY